MLDIMSDSICESNDSNGDGEETIESLEGNLPERQMICDVFDDCKSSSTPSSIEAILPIFDGLISSFDSSKLVDSVL